jgi:thiol-disulfide isomerase/thioredoxin
VVGESSKLQLEEARSLPFMDLKSDSHTLKGWEGKVLILNFWATWCPPCRREIPAFIELQDEFGDKGLQFVGVAVDNAKRVATYAVKNGINYPTLLGESNGLELSIMLGNSASVLPYTVIFDRNGTMISSHRGEVSRELMLEQVSPLL